MLRSIVPPSVFLFAIVCATATLAKTDLSTPQTAAKTFIEAMLAGDFEQAKKATTGVDAKALETFVKVASNIKKLNDAAVAKFGDAGKAAFSGNGKDLSSAAREVDESKLKIDGDNATLTPRTGPATKLKKIEGDWKVDCGNLPKLDDKGMATMEATTNAAREVTDGINAGKFKTAEDAKSAFAQKLYGAITGK